MRHLRNADPEHTVVMVQVENEIGTHGVARDYSPVADRLFGRPVPEAIRRVAGSHVRRREVEIMG